ncbi:MULTISPECIES: hypothetical protein [Methylobacterium]|uniref:Uncharacterized protein n=2 Tax=Methylobacterium TaxID=407 RepID=A0A0C6FFX5_9HYPH|nr:hypothetical protein [Methylobacterium aquaticum]QRE77187.1 hypothetical protein F1D61_29875 [Methylobacterium aquaticum]BAQ45917.1 hypothetical protein Maq22A_c13515 [Methylobacterium aquaticum]
MISAILDHPVTRLIVVPLLTASYVATSHADEPTFPQRGDIWHYGVQAPGGRGVTRYATVEATPAGSSWTVTVTCGTHETRTGRILSRHVGKGTSERGRGPGLGGTYVVEGVRENFILTLRGAELDLPSQFTDARCASGVGQLSTGD